jgi:hypothetical protein
MSGDKERATQDYDEFIRLSLLRPHVIDGYMVALGDPAKVSREAMKTSISDVLPNEWTPI